ncbi:repeat-containing protein, partial [Candidatus Magnetomorum sp. HK-1]
LEKGHILSNLRRGKKGLLSICGNKGINKNNALLIVVDQFEEIFRFRKENIDEAESFVNLLIESAQQETLPIYIIITMRSDFLGHCSKFQDLPQTINDSQYLVPRLYREQLQQVIEAPAQLCGGNVSTELVNVLLNEIDPDLDLLPILQHALMCMWKLANATDKKELNLNIYESIGTLDNALSKHADRVYNSLTDEQQRIAEIVFKALCHSSDYQQDVRRPVSIAEISKIAKKNKKEIIQVVDVFRESDINIITPSSKIILDEDDFIDISHESLIRQWQTLDKWVKEEAKSAKIYQLLEKTAKRNRNKEAALYRNPDLKIALDWKSKYNPTKEWADRYGKDFKLAMDFLDESKVKNDEEEKKAKKDIQERTTELFKSKIIHAALLSKLEKFATAKELLRSIEEIENNVPIYLRHARNLLTWYIELITPSSDWIFNNEGPAFRDIAVSPDGQTIAACGESNTIKMIDIKSGKIIQEFKGHNDNVNKIIFHPNGSLLISGSDDTYIIIWSVSDAEQIQKIETQEQVLALALHPDRKRFASAGTDNSITMWEIDSQKLLRKYDGHKEEVTDIAFNYDGTLLCSTSNDGTAILWDVETEDFLQEFVHNDNVNSTAFHPQDNSIFTSSESYIFLLNLEGFPPKFFQHHRAMVLPLLFINTSIGVQLVSASSDRSLKIFDTKTSIVKQILQGHQSDIIQIDSYEKHIYSIANDYTIRRWEAESSYMQTIEVKDSPVCCSISPNCQKIAFGFSCGMIQMFYADSKSIAPIWKNRNIYEKEVKKIIFLSNSNQIITIGDDNSIKLINSETGQVNRTFQKFKTIVNDLSISPNENHIAIASNDGRIGLYMSKYDSPVYITAHNNSVESINFDCTGNYLISSGESGNAKVWKMNSQNLILIKELNASNEALLWSDFSLNSEHIVCAGRDKLVHVYNSHTYEEIAKLEGHEYQIFKAVFMPGGIQILSMDTDGKIIVWDIETLSELFSYKIPITYSGKFPIDFDFKYTSSGTCKLAIPLPGGRLIVYKMDGIFARESGG